MDNAFGVDGYYITSVRRGVYYEQKEDKRSN